MSREPCKRCHSYPRLRAFVICRYCKLDDVYTRAAGVPLQEKPQP